ncbi:MAG: hypothetical protein OHK0011_01110 [Turneriella sp.]
MLRRYLRAAWKRGIYSVLLEVLRALRDRDLVEMRIVDRILEDIHKKTVKAMETIGTHGYLKVVSAAEPNLYPLKEMLRQKAQDQAERLRGYRYLVKQFDNPHISIGRRGQDLIRELSMEALEEGFLNGNPSVFTEKKLVQKIVKSGKLYKSEQEATEALSSLHHDVVRDIPLFHEDGNVKFMLHEKTRGVYQGRYRAWDVERYADLVAFTTAAEADAAANVEHAKELGTRLIKWNSTGKGVAFYESIGDTRCAAVDGRIAAIVPEGVTINGIRYPYYKELLPGPYNTCHPYCRHRMTPLPEEAVGDVKPPRRIQRGSEFAIQQAEQKARDLGVRHVDFGHSRNQAIADRVVHVLEDLKAQNKPVPRAVKIDASEFSNIRDDEGKRIPPNNVPAFFRQSRTNGIPGSIFINPRAHFWADSITQAKLEFNRGWWSSDDPLHVLHHEIGHFLHNYSLGNDVYQFFKETPLTTRQISVINTEVSEYATENPLEFVAETYAALRAGRKFSEELLRLYSHFGGIQ